MSEDRRPLVAVIGAGISGLSAAYRLIEIAQRDHRSVEVVLLEAADRPGGVIRTRAYGDYLLECGPDSFITQKPWAVNLCHRLGLAHSLISTNERHRKVYVAFGGKLNPLPEGFIMLAPTRAWPFVSSPLFSVAGKARMAMDLLLPPGRSGSDESLASFVRRRFGQEALERVAQPLVGGIYTADPEKLSLKATMPRFLELEQAYGSVIRGILAETRRRSGNGGAGGESGARYSMFVTLDEGLELLVDTLVKALPPGSLRLGAGVDTLSFSEGDRRWRIVLAGGDKLEADAVIVSTPVRQAGQLLAAVDPRLSAELASIQAASSVVLNLIYNRQDVPHPLDGFGFVVPATEGSAIIACTFANVKFPIRAPEGKIVFRVFMGGAIRPEVCAWPDAEIERAARGDLERYLGVAVPPQAVLLSRHPSSMPQLHVGHLDLVKQIEERVTALPMLALAGNAYRGVGIPDCVHSGETAAERVLAALFACA